MNTCEVALFSRGFQPQIKGDRRSKESEEEEYEKIRIYSKGRSQQPVFGGIKRKGKAK